MGSEAQKINPGDVVRIQSGQKHCTGPPRWVFADFVEAENSMGFHADQEAVRILGNSINFSRLGLVALSERKYPPRHIGRSEIVVSTRVSLR